MPLPPETIEAIRQRADILQVIGAAVTLKKKGQRWVGLCPFHHENTPSFSVTPDKGLYYCFGCHVGGDLFSFVMRHEGLDFTEAARKLADRVGVQTEPESPAVLERRRREKEMARANAYAQAFFEHSLWSPAGEPGRAYLAERSVPEEQAKQWRLGYGGRSGELLGYLEAKRVPVELAVRAGFVTEDADRALFDQRLVFPISAAGDRIVGFGARRLGDRGARRGEIGRSGGPKYINTRESTLFQKRELLYGWPQAQEAIRRSRRVTLVEGYLDVLACDRAGVGTAVAALGTAFTEEHARTCARLAQEALLLFDGDAAGTKASREATIQVARAGMKALVAPLPAGDDPDSLVCREGDEVLVQHLRGARSAIEHFITVAVTAQMSIEDRSRAAGDLAPLILALGSGLERDLYTARLAEAVGVNVEQMKLHLEAAARQRPHKQSKRREATPPGPSSAPTEPSRPSQFEIEILRELMLYPELTPRLAEIVGVASDPMRVLCGELAAAQAPMAEILERRLGEQLSRELTAIKPREFETPEEAPILAQRTFEDVRHRLELEQVLIAHREVLEELREAEARGDSAEQTAELMRRSQELDRRKRELRTPRSTS